ncbi:Aste57867_6297 [Aphanomyces stellatus]|uniref:Aste57867_6297 protein n=1 Tax=Aphanomyces stellatus TaxID=120398 RepID=A0A485KFN9_9STRA|nr:hypothetical protein As57867_006283 [Aphanomyces stellatus]VFT83295.1 Aste57867_6297 [Aphanomyces stellatus]
MMTSDLVDALEGKPLLPRPSFLGVVDYIEAQDKTATEDYWRSYLSGFAPCPIALSGHVASDESLPHEPLEIETQVSLDDVKAAAQRVGVTPAELNKIAWAVTLQKYTRQNDVVFGQVMANRDIPVKDADSILGPLINTVPYRVRFDETAPIQSIFDAVEAERASMMTHSYSSLADIKRWSGVDGELFDTLFVYQQLPDVPQIEQGSGLNIYGSTDSPHSHEYNLELLVTPQQSCMRCQAWFNPCILTSAQTGWILAEYDYTLNQLCAKSLRGITTSSLFDISQVQTQFIQSASLGSNIPLPYEMLHHAFEERAGRHPDVRAVEFEGSWLSYGELNDMANALAAKLIDIGVGVNCRVAVIMDRCLEFPLGLLAVLKVGAAVMPLDASFPVSRLRRVISDATATAALTTPLHSSTLTIASLGVHVESVSIDKLRQEAFETRFESPMVEASGNDEAVVLFTSGSTGRPKGVVLLHKGVVNVIAYRTREFGMVEGARVLQFLAIGFDMSQWEIWGALSNGATLVLRGEDAFKALATVDSITIPQVEICNAGRGTIANVLEGLVGPCREIDQLLRSI